MLANELPRQLFPGTIANTNMLKIRGIVYRLFLPIIRILSIPFAKKILKQISIVLSKENISNFVYLFQFSYYTNDGEKYISGGGERYVNDIASILSQNGYSVILFQLGLPNSKFIWYKQHKSLWVIGIPGRSYMYPLVTSLLPHAKLSIYSGYLNFGYRLLHPNIMISHGITWDDPYSELSQKSIFRILQNIDCLISVDTNTLSWIRTTYSRYFVSHADKKMLYIPNYVDLNKYRMRQRNFTEQIHIIFPRRCCSQRGFWLVSKILPDILSKHSYVIFEFIGFIHNAEISNEIDRLIQCFPDQLSHKQVDEDSMPLIYQQSDIVLIPTLYSEGTSLSCIEAMACGCAIIATNVGGLPNLIINNYNGILINPNVDELKKAIELLISNKNLRKTLGNNAHIVSQTFSKRSWEKQWEKCIIDYIK